jgi:glycosyltransferase involved in cell wall biosynthesis
VPWKNQTGFIEAASRLARELPEARFLLVGDDIFGRDSRYKNDLLDRIKNSPIAEKVSFLGWQKQMECVWPKIDCLVHTAEREPFGRVVIEAMAHKVPVIAADRCGPAEIIRNGRTGILFEPGDVEQLTEAMLKIARDRTFAAAIAQGAERQVLSNFTADKTAAGIEQIYARVLAAD